MAAYIRVGFFIGILVLMMCWEMLAPRRPLSVKRSRRWFSNLLIVVVDTLLVRLIFPGAVFGVAVFAKQQSWGLFNAVHWEAWAAVLLSVVILDLTIYLQHVLFHAVPFFWRIHRMHHMDLDFDVTTGIRFHPFEIFLSLFIKFTVVAAIGAPPVSVLIFEILLNGTSLFNHGNVRLVGKLDRLIRAIFVTPDMHRVHHSSTPRETNSNFGFNFSFWDRIFQTYRPQPKLGHENMVIGLNNFRDSERCVTFWGLLRTPFIKEVGNYPLNRGQ